MAAKENSNILDIQNCICCDNCENWFHQSVVNSPVKILNLCIHMLSLHQLNLFLTTTMPYLVITLTVTPGFISNVLISHSIHTTLCTIIKTLNSGSAIIATFCHLNKFLTKNLH